MLKTSGRFLEFVHSGTATLEYSGGGSEADTLEWVERVSYGGGLLTQPEIKIFVIDVLSL